MSQQATRPAPPPSAWPCTRATTGAGQPSIASSIARSRSASATFSSYDSDTDERIHSTSAPAEKDGPSPLSSTARASPMSLNASVSSPISAASNALRRSGRAIAIRRIESSRSMRNALTSLDPYRSGANAYAEREGRITAQAEDQPVIPKQEVGSETRCSGRARPEPGNAGRRRRRCTWRRRKNERPDRLCTAGAYDGGRASCTSRTRTAPGSWRSPNTAYGANNSQPVWSPNGSRIAFESNRRGDTDLWTIAPDASRARRSSRSRSASTAIRPGTRPATKIAFETNRNGNFDVYVINADGTGRAAADERCGERHRSGVVARRHDDRLHE